MYFCVVDINHGLYARLKIAMVLCEVVKSSSWLLCSKKSHPKLRMEGQPL